MRRTVVGLLMSLSTVMAAGPEPNLVPWPQSVERGAGALTPGKTFRIVYADARLKPAAEILAGDIFLCFGRGAAVAADKAPGPAMCSCRSPSRNSPTRNTD